MSLVRAIHTLGTYTGGRFDIWNLAGPNGAGFRAEIMGQLVGVLKFPKSKAGVTVLRAEFYRQCAIIGETPNAREDAFREYCRAVVVAAVPALS